MEGEWVSVGSVDVNGVEVFGPIGGGWVYGRGRGSVNVKVVEEGGVAKCPQCVDEW